MTDVPRMRELQEVIARALLETCREAGIESVEMNALCVDQSTSGNTRNPDPTAPKVPIRTPRPAMMALRDLREACYEPGKGAWLSMRAVVHSTGQFQFHFNYDRRPYTSSPTPDLMTPPEGRYALPDEEMFLDDLAAFPRDADTLPDWYPRPADPAIQIPVELRPEENVSAEDVSDENVPGGSTPEVSTPDGSTPTLSTPAQRAARAQESSLFPPALTVLMGSSAWVLMARATKVHAVSVLAANDPEWEHDEPEPERWVRSRIFDLVYAEKLAGANGRAIKALWREGRSQFRDRELTTIPDTELVAQPSDDLEVLLEDVCDLLSDLIDHRIAAAAGVV